MSQNGEQNPQRDRLYGVPTSIQPQTEQAERLELSLTDHAESAQRLKLLQEAVEQVFTDSEAAEAFRRDPRAFLAKTGVPEAVAAYDSLEVKLGQAMGDKRLRELAEAGDVEGFVDELTHLGLMPPAVEVSWNRAEAMGFVPVFPVAVVSVVVLAVYNFVAVASHAGLFVNLAVVLAVWLKVFVTGPGGDNPDESNDAASHVPALKKLNSPHFHRLLNKYLHTEMLQKLASTLHDRGFGAEVTAEVVKRAILAAWRSATTGEMPEADRAQIYTEIVTALGSQELLDQVPELASASRYAMLTTGFAGPALDLMMKMQEPVRFVSIDFNPQELLAYQKVLLIPTGGLYGLDKSLTFKERLEEYIRLGGTVICMAQQRGYDFTALPGGLEGYGWAEDQSCHAQSVVITAPHAIFAGQQSDVMDVSVDGFFTKWPEEASVLLRRRINGQPALLTYRYGQGRVLVTSAYADWGIAFNQLTRDERILMRDALAWSRFADQSLPEFDPNRPPFRLTFTVKNRSVLDATRILLHAVDPEKRIHPGRYSVEMTIAAGESREVSLEVSDATDLGYWSLDAVLQDANGQMVDLQYDAATFLVDNFDDTIDGIGYKSEPITFSAVAEEEHLLAGGTARVRLMIWNHSDQPRTVTVATDLNRQNQTTRQLHLPPGRRTDLPLEYPNLPAGARRFWAALTDEHGQSLGSTNKGFFTYNPAVDLKVTTDKGTYRPGEAIAINLAYSSTIKAVFTCDLKVAITDPGGATLFDERFSESLRPQIPAERALRFTLPMSVRYGAFKVSAEAEVDGQRIGYSEVYFTPVLEGTLQGAVLDAVTGIKVDGAKVWLDSGAPVLPGEDGGDFQFTTGAGGHWVTAEAPGYGRARAYTVVAPERSSQVRNIYLSPQNGQVEGLVMDMVTNAPVTGAKVAPDGAPVQTIGPDGAFAVSLPRGERWIRVSAPGYAGNLALMTQVYPGRTGRFASFFLAPTTGWVEGVIRRADTGEPLAGAEVYTPGAAPVPVGADGRFSLTYPVGQRELRARAPGYAEAAITVYVPAGRAVRVDDFYVVPTFGEVEGVVYDTVTRTPVAGAQVVCSGAPLAITGPDGRYRFRLPAQNQSLEAKAPGYRTTAITVSVVAGKRLEGLDMGMVPAFARLEGVVRSAADGSPIAGAYLRETGGAQAITDEAGAFQFTLDVKQASLTVESPAYQSTDLTVDLFPGRTTRLDQLCLIPRRGEVTGRIRNTADGAAIAGARVWVDSVAEARTDADGNFRLALPVGQAYLRAEAEGFQPLQRCQADLVPGKEVRLGDIWLAPLYGTLAGSLTSADGAGMAGVTVRADTPALPNHPDAIPVSGIVVDRVTGDPLPGARAATGTQVTFTDQQGRYQLLLTPGWYGVEISLAGYRTLSHSLQVESGFAAALAQTELQPERGQVSGQVIDAITGQPVVQARVWAVTNEWVLTDAEGRFTLDLPPGDQTVQVAADGYNTSRSTRIDVEPGRRAAIAPLSLSPLKGWVTGQVRDALTGLPLPGALVWPASGESVATDADGRFRLRLAPDFQSLTAVAQGYRDQAQVSVRVQAGSEVVVNGLCLWRLWAEVAGTVASTLDGTPLSGIRVWAGNDLDGAAITDEQGRFRLRVTPGILTLQAEGSGYQGRASAEVFAIPSRTTEASLLKLLPVGAPAPQPGPGTLAGRLVDAVTGQPLAGRLVWYDDPDLALGVIRQDGNTAISNATAPFLGTQAVAGDGGWTDYQLRFEAKALDDDGWGCLLRYLDDQNHYRFLWVNDPAGGGPSRRLERVASGQRTLLWEDRTPYPARTWVAVEAALAGAEITLRIDGREVAHVTDQNGLAAGRIGLFCWAQQGQLFRSIRVDGADGPLFTEPCTGGMAAWSITDAPGTQPKSAWTAVAPTGTYTDAEGRFTLTGLPQGAHSLFMDLAGYLTYRQDGRIAYLTIQPGQTSQIEACPLPNSSRLEGVVRDATTGQPAAGVQVRVLNQEARTTTGADGRFAFALPALDPSGYAKRHELRAEGGGMAGRDLQLYAGELPLSAPAEADLALEPASGGLRLTLTESLTGAPAQGVEVYHGDPELRWGGFTLARDEGSREGVDENLEGPALITGETGWSGDAEVRFQARCSRYSGWGALLRYQHRFSTYRLFYLAPAGQEGALIRLVRRQGSQITVLAEARQAHQDGRWYDLRFAVTGGGEGSPQTLVVELDGAPLFQVVDEALTEGAAGIIGWGQSGTTLRQIIVTGPDATVRRGTDRTAWREEEGFGYLGGNATTVTGPFTGTGTADVTHLRYGSFSYHFPVPAGDYRVELTMTESAYQQADRRIFTIGLNGREVESNLDLFAVAGFKGILRQIYPAAAPDGWIHLLLRPAKDNALVNYIRVFAGAQATPDEKPLYTVRCGSPQDRPVHQARGLAGFQSGGTPQKGSGATAPPATPPEVVATLQTYREGNSAYRLRLPSGQYAVELYFAEQVYQWAGQRLFDVLLNGRTALRGIDLAARVGKGALHREILPIASTGEPVEIALKGTYGSAVISGIRVPGLAFIHCGSSLEMPWIDSVGSSFQALPEARTVTDADGIAQFGDLPAGDYLVRASRPGWSTTSGNENLLTVTLTGGRLVAAAGSIRPRTGAITGQVLDGTTGLPVAGAEVWYANRQGVTLTDAEGRFRLDGLAPTSYLLNTAAPDYKGLTSSTQQMQVTVEAGLTATVQLTLLPKAYTPVRPYNPAGKPTVTAADGAWHLMLPPGRRTLTLEGSPLSQRRDLGIDVYPGLTSRIDLTPATGPAKAVLEGRCRWAGTGTSITDTTINWGDQRYASGVLRQLDNVGIPLTSSPAYLGTSALAGDPAWSDYRFAFQTQATSNGGWGALFRYRDPQNYYRLLWLNDTSKGGPLRRLERVADGTFTTLAEDNAPYPTYQWIETAISAAGGDLTVTVQGRPVFQVHDAEPSIGKIGLFCWYQPNQLFRAIRVEAPDQTPLFTDPMTNGMAAWTVANPTGLSARWEVVAPSGTPLDAGGSFRLAEIPDGTQVITALGDVKTSTADNNLLSLPCRSGDRWWIETPLGEAQTSLRAQLVENATGQPITGVRAWAAADPRQVVVSADDGRIAIALPNTPPFSTPTERQIYLRADGYQINPTYVHASPQLPPRPGAEPVFRLTRSVASLTGQVSDAVSGQPLPGVQVGWGEADWASGGIRVTADRFHGEPATGLLHGPVLLTGGDATWADTLLTTDVKATRPTGFGLLLRYGSTATYYRALLIHDPDQQETAFANGKLQGETFTATRNGAGLSQPHTGNLKDGTWSGTYTHNGKTYPFHARRRRALGNDPVAGEWVMNQNGTSLRIDLAAPVEGWYSGRCFTTALGGTAARIERWSDGLCTLLAEQRGQNLPLTDWSRLSFSASGNLLRFRYGEVTLLEATDPRPLPPGKAGIETVAGLDALVRGVRLQNALGELLFDGGFDPQFSRWASAPGWGFAGGWAYRVDAPVEGDTEALTVTGRYGPDLHYAFGLSPGAYQVELRFTETAFNQVGARVFDLFVNDELVDPAVDIFALTGGQQKLLIRRYAATAGPADILLRLKARKDNAVLHRIRIWPASANPEQDPPLISVAPGGGGADPDLFLCSNRWGFVGGQSFQAPADTAVPGAAAEEVPLLINQRLGSFHYKFNLPPGQYQPELSFVELQDPRRSGARVFDIYGNGRLLAEGLDVALAAGSGLLRLRPDVVTVGEDRELDLEFVSRVGYAMVNLIRIFPAGRSVPVAVADAGGPTDRDWLPGLPTGMVWAARAPQSTLTDEDGAFRLDGLPSGRQNIGLQARGFATLRGDSIGLILPALPGVEQSLQTHLTPATAALTGEVVDIVTGQPVEGAEVWYRGAASPWQTDENGSFTIADFPTDRREFYARARGYRSPGANDYVMTVQVSGGQVGRYRIFLTPITTRVEGSLRDAITGEPVEGARIWLGAQRRGEVTGADGRFVVPDFPAGQPLPVYAACDGYRAPGYQGHVISFQSVAGRTASFNAFLLPTHGTVQGKVLDLISLQPVEEALVYVDGGEISTRTDALGQFRLRVPEGDHRLYVEAAGYIGETGHNPTLRLTVAAGKAVESTLYLKPISGAVEGQVVDSITLQPIEGALVYVDEGFANILTDAEGRYRLPQSNKEHTVYVKAVDYASDREDGWMATAPVEPNRDVTFNHLLRPTLQLVSFSFVAVPTAMELVAGEEQTVTCRVRNTGKREGGATIRLIIPGFLEQENTEWIAPGAEADFGFTFRMPADALSAPHQEVIFELASGERRRLMATVRGAEVAVTATLDKELYTPGELAVLRVRVTNQAGGTYRIFTRAQLGDLTQVGPIQTLQDELVAEHVIPVDDGQGKLFFGVYLETGRSIHLDAFYLPRKGGLAQVSSSAQSYLPADSVPVTIALTEEGQAFFAEAGELTAQLKLVRADDGAEILPPQSAPLAADQALTFDLTLPAQMRQGTYLAAWQLQAGEKSAEGTLPLDVRGYKARFLEFLTDRFEYLRADSVAINGSLELSHAITGRLELKLINPEQQTVGESAQELTLPAGRSAFTATLPFETGWAGHHTLVYTLHAIPAEGEPLLLAASMQGVDVQGPVLLAVNTDRRTYRPGDPIKLSITARGQATVPLRLTWNTGEVALERMVVLNGLQTLSYDLVAPATTAVSLKAEFLADTLSLMTAPAYVRA